MGVRGARHALHFGLIVQKCTNLLQALLQAISRRLCPEGYVQLFGNFPAHRRHTALFGLVNEPTRR
jgi:hypothetical protein